MFRVPFLLLQAISWCLLIPFTRASSSSAYKCNLSTQQQVNENGCACHRDVCEFPSAVWGYFHDGCSDENNCNNWVVKKHGWPMGSWCFTGSIRSFDALFYGQSSFNDDISSWDVSRATSMGSMFHGATSFNQDLSSWNVSRVRNMYGMFANASSFNQDLSSWDVSAVRNMNGMFTNASSFSQDLSPWDVSKVKSSEKMFSGATLFEKSVVCSSTDAWKESVACTETASPTNAPTLESSSIPTSESPSPTNVPTNVPTPNEASPTDSMTMDSGAVHILDPLLCFSVPLFLLLLLQSFPSY